MIIVGSGHAEVLANIHRAAFPAGEAWGADAFALQLGLPGVFALFDQRGGLLLARVIHDQGEILTLAIAAAMRRQGLGSALVAAAMGEAASRGARTLWLEVSAANAAARSLYSKAGFVTAGQRRRYYADGTDALVLRADLNPCAATGA
jgi:[ribosomal protein S18]-alanine N-acetyltransferase